MKIEVYSPTIRRKEMDAVLTVMIEDRIGPGEHTRFLVSTAKEQLGFDFCLALRSPAVALQLALEAIGAERGRGVLISALSPVYYERVLRSMGLVPVYCDTASDLPLMPQSKIEALMSSRPLCMVFHETLGYTGEKNYAELLGIPVIVDTSQSFGSAADGKAAGAAGNLVILGLEERDMITAGGGALLYAHSRRDASPLRALGELPPEYALPDLNAAMAAVQFRESGKNLEKRREIAGVYTKASQRTRHKRFVQNGEFEYNNYVFSLMIETGAKDVKAYAKRKDIVVEEAFDLTLSGSGVIPSAQCPNASSLALRTLLFPLYPRLGSSRAEKVAKLITTLP
ncbi:MAG: DegT/DnrJ/EryC1/StrS family aminotransferase [Treponema sp.]|jgi:dTDP-4-amino-4,6-dideoxygalactose transaminase|nr:DegT/DnrJ/EryC1/StrS family aminotransferase [Treponema sp.]